MPPTSTTRTDDVTLWRRWKESGSSNDLERLMAQMMPVISNEVRKSDRVVSKLVLEAQAKQIALAAFKTYDPNRVPPVLLSTHVVANLQKLSRTRYEHQSTLSVPEQHRITFNKIQMVHAQMEDELGRKPNLDEIADRLSLPQAHIKTVIGNVARKEFLESGEGPAFQNHTDDDVIHLAYSDMTPLQKRIFELRTGYNGTNHADESKRKDGAEIMKELNISQGQLSYQITQLSDLLARAGKLR